MKDAKPIAAARAEPPAAPRKPAGTRPVRKNEAAAQAARPAGAAQRGGAARAAAAKLAVKPAAKRAPVRKAAPGAAQPKVVPATEPVPALASPAIAPFVAVIGTGADQVRAVYAQAHERSETLQRAVTESAGAAARGLIEVNGKVLDLMRAQSEAAFAAWRAALTARSVSDAVEAQSSGLRTACETAAARWKDLAETTSRLMGEALTPIRSVWTAPPR